MLRVLDLLDSELLRPFGHALRVPDVSGDDVAVRQYARLTSHGHGRPDQESRHLLLHGGIHRQECHRLKVTTNTCLLVRGDN